MVSTIFSFSASIALFELTILDFNRKVALFAVWFLNIFPTAYFLQASYTESVFLTMSILSIYFLRRNLPFVAGVFGLLSTATRFTGILLLPSMLIESKFKIRNLPALLLTPLGFIFYLLINLFTFNELFYFTKPLSTNWYKKLDWPWEGISRLVHQIPPIHNPNFYTYTSEVVTAAITLFMTFLVFFKLRKSYGLYMLLNLLLFTSTNFIQSTPRYILILFPIYILLAKINNKLIVTITSLVFIILLIYFTSLYTKGLWAF